MRAIKIEDLNEFENVYDITVEKHHNFALENKVFVHNSSGFHTLPKHSEVKKMYISRWRSEGGLIIASDYSQLEVMVIASLANEPLLLKAIREGADIHTRMASLVHNKPEDQIDKKTERTPVKAITFGILYGSSTKAIVKKLNMPKHKVQKLFDLFFTKFVNLDKYIKDQHQFVIENGYIVTAFNRILYIPESQSDNRKIMNEGLRKSQNYGVQSVAYNTPISLLDGNSEQIGVMAENLDKDYYGWSVDQRTGNEYPVKLEHPRKTGEKHDWIKVILDNKMEFETTTEHLWIMRDGSEKRADELKPGDSLMPHYLKKGRYIKTKNEVVSHLVAKSFLDNHPIDDIKYCVCHKDLNHVNNDPSNLEYLSYSDASVKREKSVIFRWNKCIKIAKIFSDKKIPWTRENLWDTACWRLSHNLKTIIRYSSYVTKVSLWEDFVEYALKQVDLISSIDDDLVYMEVFQYISHIRSLKKRYCLKVLFDLLIEQGIDITKIVPRDYCYGGTSRITKKDLEFLNECGSKIKGNHKVVKVEPIHYKEPKPTYDISVPNYLNFAIGDWDDGIFIHNSAASDLVVSSIVDQYKDIKRRNLNTIFVGSVHDSIIYDIAPGELCDLVTLLKYYGEKVPLQKYKWLKAPIRLDISIGTSWGNAADIELYDYSPEFIKGKMTAKRKDIRALALVASKAYEWEGVVINEEEQEDSSFENFIKDNIIQTIEFEVHNK